MAGTEKSTEQSSTSAIPSDDSPAVTYVYDNIEVRKTGRVARRTVGTASALLWEIAPVTGPSWKKWVRETDLYQITTQKQESNTNE